LTPEDKSGIPAETMRLDFYSIKVYPLRRALRFWLDNSRPLHCNSRQWSIRSDQPGRKHSQWRRKHSMRARCLIQNLGSGMAAAAVLLLTAVHAHSQSYTINWCKIAGGGGTSTGGVYSVSGTIGQHDAGGPMTGGSYSLTGGFWSLISVVQTPGAPSLTITVNPQLSTVTISWPSSAGSFTLQSNGNLATSNWVDYGGTVNSSEGTNSITVSPPAGNLFFRLKSP
jgi:hypothetical protein